MALFKRINIALFTIGVSMIACAATLTFYGRIMLVPIADVEQYFFLFGIIFIVAVGMNLRNVRATSLNGAKFSEVRSDRSEANLTFQDVAANDEARRSLMGLVNYLKSPGKYAKLGARMPRGVLLYGPPGTGKTLLARALAGEAGVPFFALSGSDFVQMYVGVGASRVRDLFQKARKAGKCVIFIDEIDAMGKKRDDQSSDEREQTLNALLSEMSGFRPNDGTIVIAATNRIDTLDPALLRPGRFDRQIEVGLPGKQERLSIIKLHCKNKPLCKDVDLDVLAAETAFFSGASLESMLNEAAIFAAEQGARSISQGDINRAYLTVVAGEDRVPRANPDEKSIIALHEAGHALATKAFLPDQRLTRVSILPTGKGAAGYSLSIPNESTVLTKGKLLAQVRVLLAGRAAETLVGEGEDLTSGASNDLKRAAELVATMVMDLGMESEPGLAMRGVAKACGAGAPNAFKLCRDVLNREFEVTTRFLTDHMDELMKLTEALVEREALSGEELSKVIAI